MNNDEFKSCMDLLQMSARSFMALTFTITDEDLATMLKTIDLAESVGHIVDPTQYREASQSGSLQRQRCLIEAHQQFRASIAKHFKVAP